MVCYGRSACDSGLNSRVQQRRLSRGPYNFVLGWMGVRVKHKDEEVERSMVFNNCFVDVPRTFGEYCSIKAIMYSVMILIFLCGKLSSPLWNETRLIEVINKYYMYVSIRQSERSRIHLSFT